MTEQKKTIAYFSMEFALQDDIPNFAGGLGVLAADILYSCADMEVPTVGISLIYHQSQDPGLAYDPTQHMEKLDTTTHVTIEGREVVLNIYKYEIKGKTGHVVPIFFLSTNNETNGAGSRDITRKLYTNDWYRRLCQEMILGVGGVRALMKLGYGDQIDYYHMNEGHAAPLTLELLKLHNYDESFVKNHSTFTTHTPVPAGHDYFDYDMAYRVLGKMMPLNIKKLATEAQLGMTQLALNLSVRSNSVAEKHRQVCENMFPGFHFENVTNGIYMPRWVSHHVQKVLDDHLPGWQDNPEVLNEAVEKLPSDQLLHAKYQAKKELIDWINDHPEFYPWENIQDDDWLNADTLTICFARRCVPYKRPDLIFKDLEKLRNVGYKKIQLIFAARWHKHDTYCSNMYEKLQDLAKSLRGQVRVIVLPDYNIDIARKLVGGADVWLNNPIPPQEASGTSGMKAALNGGLNLSILDGWWIEGIEKRPRSGWGFSPQSEYLAPLKRDDVDAQDLYKALGDAVDCYYNRREEWEERMKESIALLSFFNTHRVVNEYYEHMWQ